MNHINSSSQKDIKYILLLKSHYRYIANINTEILIKL